jgi:hypothetical protein
MQSLGTIYNSSKIKKQNLIKRFFHQVKRFEDKYLVRTSQDGNESLDRQGGSPLAAGGGHTTPLQLKSSIHPKIIDFTYNLSRDTRLLTE